MIKNKIKPQSLLSTLWIFVLFNMVFRDLHEFLKDGYIQEMMSLEITQEVALLYGGIAEIPIAMVVLARLLKNKINRWANAFAATITSLGLLSTIPSADMDDVFFTIMNMIALLSIIRVAWKLPSFDANKTNF